MQAPMFPGVSFTLERDKGVKLVWTERLLGFWGSKLGSRGLNESHAHFFKSLVSRWPSVSRHLVWGNSALYSCGHRVQTFSREMPRYSIGPIANGWIFEPLISWCCRASPLFFMKLMQVLYYCACGHSTGLDDITSFRQRYPELSTGKYHVVTRNILLDCSM